MNKRFEGKTLFYVQLKDTSDNPSLRYLPKSLLEHCMHIGMNVSTLEYKRVDNSDNSTLLAGSVQCTSKILKRSSQKKTNFLVRYLYECWLVLRAAFHFKLWKSANVCLIYSFPCTFLHVWIAKVVYRKKAIYWVQDLWPYNGVTIGAIKQGSFIFKVFAALELYAYQKADIVVTISEDIQEKLIYLGISPAKIKVVHNWSSSDSDCIIEWDENRFATQFGLSQDIFYAVYAGNIGAAQNIDLIISAAKLLSHRLDIQFLIVGDGLALDSIKEQAVTFENVIFIPMQSLDVAPHVYAAASVNIISLKKGMIFAALPSKTAMALACGRPLIACVDIDSRYADILRRYEVGQVVDPTDAQALADAIVKQADMENSADLSERLKVCFNEQFSQRVAFENFNKVFDHIFKE